jgi:hypothetical protein
MFFSRLAIQSCKPLVYYIIFGSYDLQNLNCMLGEFTSTCIISLSVLSFVSTVHVWYLWSCVFDTILLEALLVCLHILFNQILTTNFHFRTIERSNFKPIVHISAITQSESSNIHLLAVTTTGTLKLIFILPAKKIMKCWDIGIAFLTAIVKECKMLVV